MSVPVVPNVDNDDDQQQQQKIEELTSRSFQFVDRPFQECSLDTNTSINVIADNICQLLLNIKEFSRYTINTYVGEFHLFQSIGFDVFTFHPTSPELQKMIGKYHCPSFDTFLSTMIDIMNSITLSLPIPREKQHKIPAQHVQNNINQVLLSEIFTNEVCKILVEMIFEKAESPAKVYIECMKYLVTDNINIRGDIPDSISNRSKFYKYLAITRKNQRSDALFTKYLATKQYIVENKFNSIVDAKRITELLENSATVDVLKEYKILKFRKDIKIFKQQGKLLSEQENKQESKQDGKQDSKQDDVNFVDRDKPSFVFEEIHGLQDFLDQFCEICDNPCMMTDTTMEFEENKHNKKLSRQGTTIFNCHIFLFGTHRISKRVVVVMFTQETQSTPRDLMIDRKRDFV